MNAARLRKVAHGDIITCTVNSRTFLAYAGTPDKRDGENGVTITPIPGKGSAVTSRWVNAKGVDEHYKRVAT